ncbi:hypothetical protein KBC03_07415 [Patescibacteria group bacterium]|nr:hypothetical protein [Patescibacteria group bacterium]
MLDLTHLIPAAEKKTVEKFMLTIDVADSFLSRAGRTVDVEKEYAKTLVSFSYQLESDELYKLCSKLPENI